VANQILAAAAAVVDELMPEKTQEEADPELLLLPLRLQMIHAPLALPT
jgi:hypothetical protein